MIFCCAAMFSHTIRGKKGEACQPEELEANCAKATNDMMQLQGMLYRANMPVSLYIPGSRDEFIQKAYRAGRITEEQILTTDCEIISDCDFLLVYNWGRWIGGGVQVELSHAQSKDIPVLIIENMDQESYVEILHFLSGLVLDKMQEPTIIKLPGA